MISKSRGADLNFQKDLEKARLLKLKQLELLKKK